MAYRMTKRPLNVCGKCGYTWYPRGKHVSAQCPQCGSSDVQTAFEQVLRAIAALLVGIGIAVAYLCKALIFVVVWLAGLIWPILLPVLQLLGLLVAVPAKWLWSIKDDLSPSNDRPVGPIVLLSKLFVLVCLSFLLIIGVITWLNK